MKYFVPHFQVYVQRTFSSREENAANQSDGRCMLSALERFSLYLSLSVSWFHTLPHCTCTHDIQTIIILCAHCIGACMGYVMRVFCAGVPNSDSLYF